MNADRQAAAVTLSRRAILPVLSSLSAPALAQRAAPLRILVPAAPGTQIDVLAHAMTEPLRQLLDRPVIAEARPGANGIVAIEAMRQQPADGNTLLIAGGSLMTYNPALHADLPYDPVRDFTGVGLIATTPLVLVASGRSGLPDLTTLLQRARATPEVITFASGGYGHATHIAMAMLAEVMGIRLTHVPFATISPFPDLVAGNVDLLTGPPGSMLPYLPDRRLVPLALHGTESEPGFGGVPSFRAAGFDAPDFPGWYALYAAADTPAVQLSTLNDALNRALSAPGLTAWLARSRLRAVGGPAARVMEVQQADAAAWIPLIRRLGLTVG
jgi:tripartite-type tricarboxylate transporter receptor subunit TctC